MTDDARKRRRKARQRFGLNPDGPTAEDLVRQAEQVAKAYELAEQNGQALEGFIARIKKLDEREKNNGA